MGDRIQIDGNDPELEIASLTGDEVLRCANCGSQFELDYSDALINDDAPWPPNACCREMMGAFVDKLYRHLASKMVTSDSPHLRRGGVQLRNAMMENDNPRPEEQ
jgi:hypothetical protein